MRPSLRPFPRLQALVAAAVCLFVAEAPAAGQQERFRRTPPLPETFRELRLPEIERMVVGNGLTVAVNRRPGSPLVTLQLVIMAGEADSPPNLPHTATLAARMLGRGMREVSAGDLENRIESLGGDLSVEVFVDYTVLTLQVLRENLDRALDILRLILLQAEFTDQELASVRRSYYYELVEGRKNSESLGRRQLLRVLFENHPYQTAASPEDAVKFVGAQDVAAFFSRFYRPNNAVFAVSGDVNGPPLARKIGQLFAPWLSRDVNRMPPAPPSPNNRERICFIDHPTSQDFFIFVGNLAGPPTGRDYYPFLVLNQVLGGTMGSRLFMNLRESKGYAYDAFSGADFFRACGVFWARARVTPESIVPAVQEIARELRTLASVRAVPDEIEQAKSFLIGNLPLKFESLDGYARNLARVIGLGLGPAHWNLASDELMRVNADLVLEAARRYFSPTPVVVIIGNRAWAAQALSDFPVVEVYDNTGAFKLTLHKGVEK